MLWFQFWLYRFSFFPRGVVGAVLESQFSHLSNGFFNPSQLPSVMFDVAHPRTIFARSIYNLSFWARLRESLALPLACCSCEIPYLRPLPGPFRKHEGRRCEEVKLLLEEELDLLLDEWVGIFHL